LKTVERAHTPAELWEKIVLDKSYNIALGQIDENLLYWPEFLKHKCKQRFTRIRQMLVRKRRMKLKQSEEYEVISRKAEKREKSREVKAEKAAVVERHIEEILLDKLKNGVYDDIYNYPSKMLEDYLNNEQIQEKEEEVEYEDISDEEENLLNLGGNFHEDDEEQWDGNSDDNGDFNSKNEAKSVSTKGTSLLGNKNKKKLKLEYEREIEEENVSSKKTAKNKNKIK
jgi:protein MAK16